MSLIINCMSLASKLKLYRVRTVFRYIVNSWNNSAFIMAHAVGRKRISIYLDLLRSFLQYGADFNDYCTFSFWNKSNEEKDTYITLRRNDQLRFAFCTPRVYDLFLDKALFNTRYSKWVKRDWIATTCSPMTEVIDFINRHESVIIKPLSDYGGHGVKKIDKNQIDREGIITDLKQTISSGKNYIIEEVVENCENLKRLAPSSLNTVRLVTVIDKSGELHIIASLLRMGNGISLTDNYHDGGMACVIDMDTMQLRGNAVGMNCVRHDVHPYSGIPFDGYPVPEVKICVDMIKEIVSVEPEARYVGWDFAICPGGGIELLEGNIPPGEDITQINRDKGLWYKLLEWR